jgi:GT2 family glycosyltransferase
LERRVISVCIPSYKPHPAPNLATVGLGLPAALAGEPGELVVALNGIGAEEVGVPAGAVTVRLPRNRGVAPGWNAAAGGARGDVLVFANDDLELGPASLARLARVLRERPEAGVVGPVGTSWDIPGAAHEAWIDLSGRPDGDVAPCDVVAGFCFAVRRATFDAVGGFDEAYAPASWEEVDFCTAVRAAGLENYAVAGVQVAHEWGVSQRQPPWRRLRWDGRSELLWSIHRRNRRRFQAKWSARAPAPAAAPPAPAAGRS